MFDFTGDEKNECLILPENENLFQSQIPGKSFKNFEAKKQAKKDDQLSELDFKKSQTEGRRSSASDPVHEEDKRLKSGICPSGKHTNLKEGEQCLCLILNKLFLYQNEEPVSEWHWSFSDKVKLTDMQLKRPTKCVQGGQGMVFWVSEKSTGREYALKMKLKEKRTRLAWIIERREANILKQVEHDFIVNLFHVYETASAMFMVMDYLDGGCLWSHIAHIGLLPEDYACYYTACILEALSHLHRFNIVYRDMKAENVVLDWQGKPRLIDFGMAKKINRTPAEEADEPYPTTNYYFAAYLAPEIYMNPGASILKVDSWGLGYIISEIILGYGVYVPMPWEKTEDKHLAKGWKLEIPGNCCASPQCQDFLMRMLIQNPEERMSLDDARNHIFFAKINWLKLLHLPSPNLCHLKKRSKNNFHATYIGLQPALQNTENVTMTNSSCETANPEVVKPPVTNEENSLSQTQNLYPSVRETDSNSQRARTCKGSTNFTSHAFQCSNRNNNRMSSNKVNPQLMKSLFKSMGIVNDEKKSLKVYDTIGNLKKCRK